MATAVGVNFHARRHKKPRAMREKTTGNKIKNDGQQNKKRWATKFITTGNENHSNGQRDLELRAT